MMLGDFVIPNIAIRSLPRSKTWSYAAHAVIEGKQRKHFVGEDAEPLTLTLFLHVDFIDPSATVAKLKDLADAHEVLVVQEDSGAMIGTFVIEAIDEEPIAKFDDGTVLASTVTVKMGDPGVEASLIPKVEPIAVVGTTQPTTTTGAPEDRSSPPGDATARSIARMP